MHEISDCVERASTMTSLTEKEKRFLEIVISLAVLYAVEEDATRQTWATRLQDLLISIPIEQDSKEAVVLNARKGGIHFRRSLGTVSFADQSKRFIDSIKNIILGDHYKLPPKETLIEYTKSCEKRYTEQIVAFMEIEFEQEPDEDDDLDWYKKPK
jgi:hypothetical protein